VQLELAINGDFDQLGELLNITLYRLIQEGITNVVRHAVADRVEIRLERPVAPGNDGVALTIQDNGKGGTASAGKGFGLLGMRERVEALGGEFEVRSGLADGFSIRAWLPLGTAA
jgi:signal transduction histidine kinase